MRCCQGLSSFPDLLLYLQRIGDKFDMDAGDFDVLLAESFALSEIHTGQREFERYTRGADGYLNVLMLC